MPMSRILTLSFLVCAAMHAQSSQGTITGIVTDQTHANLPGVAVELHNESTGAVEHGVSNSAGEYTFPLLTPGKYRVTAQAKGFRSYSRSEITVESARVSRIDIGMELGQVSETIDVKATNPLLESESSTMGQFIEHQTVVDMPLTARRVGELLALQGNSVFVTGDVIRPRVSVAGGRADQQQWLIDGVNGSNVALEVPQALFNPPVEAVQEIRVQQNSYSAEYGNTSSGVVAITTRSGTNKWQGTLYEFFRNDKLDARNFFAAQKAPLRWNIYGFAVGGPIIKNKTFVFTNVEWQKERVGATQTLTVPTALQKAGDFSQTYTATGALIPIYDWTTSSGAARLAFPGNMIPASRIDPVGAALIAAYPAPNQTPSNAAGGNNFTGSNVTALNLTTWTTKVDHQLRDADRVSFRFIVHNFPTSTTPTFANAAADPSAIINNRRATSALWEEVHNFSSTLVNDFRFNFQPRFFYNLALGLDQGWPTKLGLKGVSDRSFPRVTSSGFTALGPGTQERIQTPIHDSDMVDVLSWFRGKHALKIGGEFRFVRNVDILNDQISGSLAFNTQPTGQPNVNNTGNALASLLIGFPNSASVHATQALDRRAQYWAFFIQDDIKVTRNFTLNLGVRWEAHTPRTDVNNRQNSFDTMQINPVSKTPGIVTFAGQGGLGSQIYNGDYDNFTPRVGLAWKPWGDKTVIRSGFGMFYGPPQPGSNNTSAGFEVTGNYSTPDNGITPPFLLRNGFPGGASQTTLGPGYGAVPVGSAVIFAPTYIEKTRELGYTEQWNVNIQREIGWNTLLEVSYIGTMGHRLNGPDTSINQVPLAFMGAGNAQVKRPFPQFGNVSIVAPMWGNSSYHAGNIKIEKRFSNGLNFTANYTHSKFIDDVPGSFEAGSESGGIQNYYDRKSERALSGNNVPNRFVVSSTYELPVGKGKTFTMGRTASAILGGWSVAFIGLFQDGARQQLNVQTSNTNAFAPGAQRVNVLRDPNLPVDQRTVSHWFDTSAVAVPAPYTFGNSSRSLVELPGLLDISTSLLKNIHWHERYSLQFRMESLNVLNHPNFNAPGNALGSANFGVISSAKDARITQLGLKLEF